MKTKKKPSKINEIKTQAIIYKKKREHVWPILWR